MLVTCILDRRHSELLRCAPGGAWQQTFSLRSAVVAVYMHVRQTMASRSRVIRLLANASRTDILDIKASISSRHPKCGTM
jgi:hypothetical protein